MPALWGTLLCYRVRLFGQWVGPALAEPSECARAVPVSAGTGTLEHLLEQTLL